MPQGLRHILGSESIPAFFFPEKRRLRMHQTEASQDRQVSGSCFARLLPPTVGGNLHGRCGHKCGRTQRPWASLKMHESIAKPQ